MKCDTIANGVVGAVKEVGLEVPLVVRLEGTNVELGKQDPRRVGPGSHRRRRTWPTPPRKIVELAGGAS